MSKLEVKQLRNLKAVVTGGAGFIGSHLVEKLLDTGAEVTVIDNFLYGSKIEHLRMNRSLFICEGDVRNAKLLSQILNDKDVIFHLAACVGVEQAQISPFEVLDVEIQGTLNVLSLAADKGIKRVVFASSSEVYGDSPKPVSESGPLSPKSTYAVAKLGGEEYCKAFYQKYGLKYTCLRYFNVYGPRQDERFVIPRFVQRVLSHQPILIYGDGTQTRDFTYIDDAVNTTLLAGVRPETSCQVINIGTGIAVSINELASLVVKALHDKSLAKSIYAGYDDKRPRSIEVFTRCADITKATKLLGYKPEITLQSGIEEYIKWYLKERTE